MQCSEKKPQGIGELAKSSTRESKITGENHTAFILLSPKSLSDDVGQKDSKIGREKGKVLLKVGLCQGSLTEGGRGKPNKVCAPRIASRHMQCCLVSQNKHTEKKQSKWR